VAKLEFECVLPLAAIVIARNQPRAKSQRLDAQSARTNLAEDEHRVVICRARSERCSVIRMIADIRCDA
jgi:hypothetical protein